MKRILEFLKSLLSGNAAEYPPPGASSAPEPDLSAMSLPLIEGALTIDQFWELIEAAHTVAQGNPNTKEAALRRAIESLSPENIVAFAKHWDECDARAYRWDLWGAAYVIQGGCSDDSFQDSRASLIGQGRARFEAAMADPDSLAEIEGDHVARELFFEGYQYLRWKVYKEKTGEELPQNDADHPADPVGDEWEEDDLAKVCPKLWAKYD
jgi:hypothetical protein